MTRREPETVQLKDGRELACVICAQRLFQREPRRMQGLVGFTCVGCGMCGEVSHAAVLCPSLYKAQIVNNPSSWERFKDRLRRRVVGALARRAERKRSQRAF